MARNNAAAVPGETAGMSRDDGRAASHIGGQEQAADKGRAPRPVVIGADDINRFAEERFDRLVRDRCRVNHHQGADGFGPLRVR
jgi:hypothetical protein